MRKALRGLLAGAVLAGTLGAVTPAAAVSGTPGDIKDRILAVPGVSLIEEKPVDGYRYFVLGFEQPVDHRKPKGKTFTQRVTLLHRDENRPTVFFTSGYNVSTTPSRSEPTQIVDGNQVSMEYRFFTPSRPDPANWRKLDIWQAASDQHRVKQALDGIYDENWIATGGSKGGMTATYYRRFYPHDMDATVAYVAPNDVDDDEDSAYDRFFEDVSTKECRDALNAVQREALVRRGEMRAKYAAWAEAEGATFETVGSLDKAYESVVLDLVWGFWQYGDEADCADVPPPTGSTDELYAFVDAISGFSFYTDQGLAPYTPYYYQAGTELGAPTVKYPHLSGLLGYPGYFTPRAYVPREIPMRFDDDAMRDVDRWVRRNAERMLFVYGENDPWGAEPFRLGRGAEDSHVFTAPGANHGARIAGLSAQERETATNALLDWADVKDDARLKTDAGALRLTAPDAKLDAPAERQPTLRP